MAVEAEHLAKGNTNMALDPVLSAGVKPIEIQNPMNSLVQMMQIKQAQGQFDQQQRAIEDQNKLRDYFQKNDPNSPNFVRGLYAVDPAKAMTYDKSRLDSKKDQAEIDTKAFALASDREKGYKQTLSALHDRPDLNKPMAISAMQTRLDQGLITPQMFQHIVTDLPDDPVALRQQLRQGLMERLTPEQQLTLFAPKPVEQSNGQTKTMVDNNPLSKTYGQATGAPAVQMMATPDAVLTDTRARSEGAANRGVTMRGQNMTDARATEANAIKLAEPKPMTDSQSKALLFGERMKQANDALASLEKYGTLSSIPFSRAPIVGGAVTALSSGNQQALDQAKRNFSSAVLRRESGAVISPSEYDNVDKQYFPQIGDSEQVKAQKAANRDLAIQGVLAEVPQQHRGSIKAATPQPKPAQSAAQNPMDAQALQWANANPNDPRAKAIKQRLGQ